VLVAHRRGPATNPLGRAGATGAGKDGLDLLLERMAGGFRQFLLRVRRRKTSTFSQWGCLLSVVTPASASSGSGGNKAIFAATLDVTPPMLPLPPRFPPLRLAPLCSLACQVEREEGSGECVGWREKAHLCVATRRVGKMDPVGECFLMQNTAQTHLGPLLETVLESLSHLSSIILLWKINRVNKEFSYSCSLQYRCNPNA
jgi:hypothetical protein